MGAFFSHGFSRLPKNEAAFVYFQVKTVFYIYFNEKFAWLELIDFPVKESSWIELNSFQICAQRDSIRALNWSIKIFRIWIWDKFWSPTFLIKFKSSPKFTEIWMNSWSPPKVQRLDGKIQIKEFNRFVGKQTYFQWQSVCLIKGAPPEASQM